VLNVKVGAFLGGQGDLVGALAGWDVSWKAGRSGWCAGCLVGALAGWLARRREGGAKCQGWDVVRPVGGQAGGLAGWLAGRRGS
jgi:hypothetical protein